MITQESKYEWCGIKLYQKTENKLTTYFVNSKEVLFWGFEVDSSDSRILKIIEI